MSIDDRYNNRPPMDGGYSREDRYSREDMRMRQARPRGQAPEGSSCLLYTSDAAEDANWV